MSFYGSGRLLRPDPGPLKLYIMPVLVLVLVLLLIAFWMMSAYNTLVRLRNKRQNAFADIDVQLRQRHDLVPQLVETVKGYASHERGVLQNVTEARAAAVGAKTINDKIVAEKELTSALRGLNVQMEAYPDLKANQNFLQLQGQLNEIENKLASARRYFNAATTEYNNSAQSFPGNLIARNFGFNTEMFFDLGESARKQMEEPPTIQF